MIWQTPVNILYLTESAVLHFLYYKLFKGTAVRLYVTEREETVTHFIHLSSTACMEYLHMPGVKDNHGVGGRRISLDNLLKVHLDCSDP